ncbi:MAG: ATP-binding protein [Gammaproteobacteria bacterium]|jgi:two-component system sensor histidine kinase BarA
MIGNWGIRQRVLLIALLPSALMALFLGLYFINTRISDLRAAQNSLGQAIVTQLAPASEYAVFSHNQAALRRLVAATLRERDVESVVFRDADGQVLARAGQSDELDSRPDWFNALSGLAAPSVKTLTFTSPIFPGDVDLGEYDNLLDQPADRAEPPPTLGSVTVTLSQARAANRQAEVLLKGLLITLLGLLLSFLLGLQIGLSVTDPIRRIIRAVMEFSRGNLTTRVPESAGGEIGSLERGINTMAVSVQQSQEQLQDRVDQATAELRETLEAVEVKNVQLDLARKRALEASRVKSEFLANMSHEIRTPMNAIMGFAHLLTKTGLDRVQREYVHTLQNAARSLLRLLDDVLSLSTLEARTPTQNIEPFVVEELVDDVLGMVASDAYQKGLQLGRHEDIPPGSRLSGDAVKVQRILGNLLTNAIKYTDRGSVTLTIRQAGPITAGRMPVEFTVTDTGPGIQASDLERLFQPFSQLNATSAREHGGAGLGLAISKRLAQSLGGDIAVRSQPGEGSSFTFKATFRVEEPAESTGFDDLPPLLLYCPEQVNCANLTQQLTRRGLTLLTVSRLADLEKAVSTGTGGGDKPPAVILMLSQSELRLADALHGLWTDVRAPSQVVALVPSVDRVALDRIGEAIQGLALPQYTGLSKILATLLVPSELRAGSAAENFPDMLSRLKVLVVDDNPVNLSLARTLLESLGVEVYPAGSARRALEVSGRVQPELALVDLRLPGMSGAELARHLRELAPNTVQAVIGMSANTAEEAGDAAEAFDGWLTKPFDAFQAGRAIREALAAHGERSRPPGEAPPATVLEPDSGMDPSAIKAALDAIDPEVMAILRSELPEQLANVEKLWEAGDRSALRDAVHVIHGTASFCRLAELKALAARLETSLGAESPADLDEDYQQFVAAVRTLLTLL